MKRQGTNMPKCVTDEFVRYCGRIFTPEDIQCIRELITTEPRPNRPELSRQVCRALGWLRLNGSLKDMACRVAMLRMEKDGLIELPPSRRRVKNPSKRPRLSDASDPQQPIIVPVALLAPLQLHSVNTPKASRLWNELIERYHYLGYAPLPGAQMRYLVYSVENQLLAALGFGAAAWKTAPRDQFKGGTPEQRTAKLHLAVNNARFLILPWVTSKNLASKILGAIARRLPKDWQERYHYTPVLLETFVEQKRFQGTCYKAANWIHVGHTQGRGKLDRHHKHEKPVKDIYAYPLDRNFRQTLCTDE